MNKTYENTSLSKEEKTLSIADFTRCQRDKAYKWAKDEQKRLGCIAETINLNCGDEDRPELVEGYYVKGQCVVALFVSSDKNATPLLIRYWFDDGSIKYNLLGNYDELNTRWPKYTEKLLENGVKIYKYYDGPNGGITRNMPDKAFKYRKKEVCEIIKLNTKARNIGANSEDAQV